MQYPNWFAPYAQPLFIKHLTSLAGKPDLEFAQIGAFTGDASVWLCENVLTHRNAYLYDVDTWEGSDEPEHDAFDWTDVERAYDSKTSRYRDGRILKHKQTSAEFFQQYRAAEFDFIYIDGDHAPYGVLNDGIGAYLALKVGGLVAFDDYPWVNSRTGDGPGAAVDAIEACYRGRLALIQLGAQAWFRKIA